MTEPQSRTKPCIDCGRGEGEVIFGTRKVKKWRGPESVCRECKARRARIRRMKRRVEAQSRNAEEHP